MSSGMRAVACKRKTSPAIDLLRRIRGHAGVNALVSGQAAQRVERFGFQNLRVRLAHRHELSKTAQRLIGLSREGFRAHQLQHGARRAVEK